jgi:hypothetical protein
MKFDLHWFDVSSYLASGQQPSAMLPRPLGDNPSAITRNQVRRGTFWVPQSPIIAGQRVAWSVTQAGDNVRIPINAYQVPYVEEAGLVAIGAEIGMRALTNLLLAKNLRPSPDYDITLVMGKQVDTLPDNKGRRIYVGMSIRTE